MKIREKHLVPFRGIHPNASSGGISALVPLQPGNFVIVSHNGPSGQPNGILLAEGERDPITASLNLTSAGQSSQCTQSQELRPLTMNGLTLFRVSAQSPMSVFELTPIGGPSFSSIACRELDCATYLHLPASQILFSLATYHINQQQLPLSGASSSLFTLCPESWSLFKKWYSVGPQVAAAVHLLGVDVKKRTQADRAK